MVFLQLIEIFFYTFTLMKRNVAINRRYLALVIAYIALLCHAFIPHHHHVDDSTIHFTLEPCTSVHSHHDHDHQTSKDQCISSCETINHVLLNQHEVDVDQVFVLDLSGVFWFYGASLNLSSRLSTFEFFFNWEDYLERLPVIYPSLLSFRGPPQLV